MPTSLGNTPSLHSQQELSIAVLPPHYLFSRPGSWLEQLCMETFHKMFGELIVAGCLPPGQLLSLEWHLLQHGLTAAAIACHSCAFQLCDMAKTNGCLLKRHRLQASSPSFKDHNFGKRKNPGAFVSAMLHVPFHQSSFGNCLCETWCAVRLEGLAIQGFVLVCLKCWASMIPSSAF